MKVECPTCGKKTEYVPENRWRPFCSERCKLIDLGEWASEGYQIPTEPSLEDYSSGMSAEEQPFTPTKPSNLPTIVFAIAGLFGGLFMGIGLAMVAEFTDHTVRRREQVERLLGAPMLARIPPLAPAK